MRDVCLAAAENIMGKLHARLLTGIGRRLIRRVETVILWARAEGQPAPCPQGCNLVRFDSGLAPSSRSLVVQVMAAAGEPTELVADRFNEGDEFFGWVTGGNIVSFGWVTYRDRAIGTVPLAGAVDRAFLFNFHTLEPWRGRGLYPLLLRAILRACADGGRADVFIDANVKNEQSLRAIRKVGFVPVGSVSWFVVLSQWSIRTRLAALGPRLPLAPAR